MRRLWLTALAIGALAAAGCGYSDENDDAAVVVAQAYLDAFAENDAAGICRVSAPEVAAAFAADKGSCDAGLEEPLRSTQHPRLSTGRVTKVENAPPGNPRFAVEVPGQPGRVIVVGRYGSIWRVVDGGAPAAT
jgi:hypothetical protein